MARALGVASAHIVLAPPTLHPWWAYPTMRNFTEAGGVRMGSALREVAMRPQTATLLQHARLDARSAGLSRRMRAHGVRLADVLPRVQPGLRVLVLLCPNVDRLARLEAASEAPAAAAHPHGAARQEPTAARAARAARAPRAVLDYGEPLRSFEACAAQEPAAECASRLSASNPLADGAYALYLRELMRALPPRQLRVLAERRLLRSPQRALREALAFLLAPPTAAGAGTAAEVAANAAASSAIQPGRIREAAAQMHRAAESAAQTRRAVALAPVAAVAALRAFYEEYDHELEQLLDGDTQCQ